MDTVEYNSLDSEQFETYQSIPEKKKSYTKILVAIALIGIAAYVGYQLGKRMKNSWVSSNKKEENIRSKNFKVFESGTNV